MTLSSYLIETQYLHVVPEGRSTGHILTTQHRLDWHEEETRTELRRENYPCPVCLRLIVSNIYCLLSVVFEESGRLAAGVDARGTLALPGTLL